MLIIGYDGMSATTNSTTTGIAGNNGMVISCLQMAGVAFVAEPQWQCRPFLAAYIPDQRSEAGHRCASLAESCSRNYYHNQDT